MYLYGKQSKLQSQDPCGVAVGEISLPNTPPACRFASCDGPKSGRELQDRVPPFISGDGFRIGTVALYPNDPDNYS